MFSLFGSTDAPTSSAKRDPAEFADEVANFTLQYGFDGVDADYEDFDAMNAGEAVAWLNRELHGAPQPNSVQHSRSGFGRSYPTT